MLFFSDVDVGYDIMRDHPLYVGHFFKLQGMHWKNRKARQRFIFSVANTWYHLIKKNKLSPGFIEEEVFLTRANKHVAGARTIIEHFFRIERLGYNMGGGMNSPTIVTPRRLSKKYHDVLETLAPDIKFVPEEEPVDDKLVKSQVSIVDVSLREDVLNALEEENRPDLIPAVKWLFDNPKNITFYYKPAGRIQARDTSVWPIKAIELWPAWLRSELFGTTIDIENAYCQFIMQNIEKKYANNMQLARLKYNDLFELVYNKQKFREEICQKYMKLAINNKNIGVVKRIIMALANGSNATGQLLVANSGNCEVARIVNSACQDMATEDLIILGDRLHRIARQLRAVKKDLCFFLFNTKPTRQLQKQIFAEYFKWEREARYKIWDVVGESGLMMHDGLDGIKSDLSSSDLIKEIVRVTSIKVEIKAPLRPKKERELRAPSIPLVSF